MPQRFKFTKTALEALPAPASGRATVYDSKVPKLALRITAAGSRVFYVVRRNGAKMEWLRLESFPDMSVEQAQKAAERALGEFASGNSPVQARRAQKGVVTLQEAFQAYLDDYAIPKGKKTVDDIRALWERCIGVMPAATPKKHGRPRTKHPAGVDWSARKVDSITAREIESLHLAIGKLHPTMANRVAELLSAVYNRVVRTVANPAAGVEPFKEHSRDRFIQSNELPRFFKVLADDPSRDFQHFVLLALLTGARRTNVLAMRWEEISFDRSSWRIPDSKNGDPMVLPLVPEVVEVLQAREPQRSGWVFPADSASGHLTPPKKRWRALVARAELDNLRIHDLRRSLGSWQAITGASLTIIGKRLGHKSADATMIYSRLSIDPVRASMTTATSAMLEAGELKKAADVQPIEARSERADLREARR